MSSTAGEPESPGDLAATAGSALAWSVLNMAVGRLGTLAINVALARLLGPQHFGVFAVAAVALLAMLSLNELGVSLAIVRWPDEPDRLVPTVNSISLVMSFALTALVMGLAPAFAEIMGAPEAVGVIRLMSLAIVIDGLVAAPAAMLQRNFRQRRRLIIDQSNTWVGAGVSLGLAVLGSGAVSLAIGRLAGSVVAAAMFVASTGRYRVSFDPYVARRLLAFGLPLAASSVVVFAAGYTDQMVVSATLGPSALGAYVVAFNLSSWPVTALSQPLRNVAPAAFARLNDSPAKRNGAFIRVLAPVTIIAAPACVFLGAVAAPVVAIVYGERWSAAAAPLAWLSLAAAFRIIFELAYDFIVVARGTGSILIGQLVWIGALLPAVLIGTRWGLAGVAAAQFVVMVIVMVPVYAFMLSQRGIRIAALVRAVAIPGVTCLALWVACRVVVDRGGSPWAMIVTCSGLTAIAVLAMAWPHRNTARLLLRGRSGPSASDRSSPP